MHEEIHYLKFPPSTISLAEKILELDEECDTYSLIHSDHTVVTTSNNNKHWRSTAKKCNAQQNRQAQCTTDSTSTTDLTREAQAQSTTDSTSLLLWSVVISTCALCVIPPSCRICTMPYRVVPHPSVVLIFFQLMKLSTGEISDSEFPLFFSAHLSNQILYRTTFVRYF